MKRIVIYMPTFEGGGAERNSVLIANQFARSGHYVALVVEKKSGPNRDLVMDGVAVFELGGSSHISHIPSLRKIIKMISPDVVFAQIGLSPFKVFLAITGLLSWWNVVLIYHALYDPALRPGGRMTYILSWFLTRAAGTTITVSADIKTELVARFHACPDRITVVHNPVDHKWIEKKALDNIPICAGKRPYILSVGRLVDAKDYPTLLSAFAKIKHKLDCDLVILGEGPLRAVLEKLVSDLDVIDRVYLPGYLSNPFPVYKKASLFVLSSVFEGFGNVIVEAMALGVPIVATRCPGGPRDILAEGRYGRLVPVGDSDALAAAILAEIADPVQPETLKKRARDFNVDRVAEIYLASAGI